MKYSWVLKNNGQVLDLVSHDVRLSYGMPGRASFTVRSAKPLSGLVFFTCGINANALHGQFYGYIERSTPISDQHQLLFCREKSAGLANRLPMSLRNASLTDVLVEIGQRTGYTFSLPRKDYAYKTRPFIVNTGSGYHLMSQIGEAFGIKDYVWQQRRDGLIFVGSWKDGHWPLNPIDVPANLLTKHQANQSAELLAIPGLRPGFVFNGQRLRKVDLIDNKMVVSWKKS